MFPHMQEATVSSFVTAGPHELSCVLGACHAKFEASFERNLEASKRAAATAERREKCAAGAREAAQATQAQHDRVAEAQRSLEEAQQHLDAAGAQLKRTVELEEVEKREAELGKRISSMKLGSLTCGDVVDVLKEVGLRELCGLFERNNVDGAVLEITFGRLTLSDAALETTVAARLPEEVRDVVMAPSWTEEQVAAWMQSQGFSEAIGQQVRAAGLTGEWLLFDADAVMALDVPGGDKIKQQLKTGELHKAHMDSLTHFFTRLSLEQRVPPMFKCPITLGLIPVVAPDGFFYEQSAIEKWLLARGTLPMTRKPMSMGSLMALVSLRNEIAEWLRGNRPA
eukprot:m51a1_g7395 hypothetical protein (340) ;mRNA; r:154397-155767